MLFRSEGLAEAMTLKYREMEFLQQLDYENLPFHCHRCHKVGHLAKECPLGHRRRRNPFKTFRKPTTFPAPDPSSVAPKEPTDEELEADVEIVTSGAPRQQAAPDPRPATAPV